MFAASVSLARAEEAASEAEEAAERALEADAVAALLDVDPDTYEDVTASEPAVLVQFEANWCSRCKAIKKEYVRAAQLVARLGMPVKLARFDAGSEHAEFARDLGIKSLPTFFFFRNGSATTFPMLTTAEAFAAGLDKMLDLGLDITPAKELVEEPLDVAQWLFWRGADDGQIITTLVLFKPDGLTGEAAEHAAKLEQSFVGAAKELLRFSNLRFAIARKSAVLDFFEVPSDRASLVIFKDHDEGRSDYDGELTADALRDWVLRQDTPLVTLVWHRNLQTFRKRVPKLALFFLTQAQFENQATFNAAREALLEVAQELERRGRIRRGEFTIGIADGEKYKSWVTALGLQEGQLPSIGLESTNDTLVWAGPDFVREALCNSAVEARVLDMSGSERYNIPDVCPEDWIARVKAGLPKATPTPASAAVDAAGNVKPSFEHESKYAKLTWLQVPVAAVTQFLDSALSGAMPATPLRVPASTSKPQGNTIA